MKAQRLSASQDHRLMQDTSLVLLVGFGTTSGSCCHTLGASRDCCCLMTAASWW